MGDTILAEDDDSWGDMEVQDNVIEQLLDSPSASLDPSKRRVHFTANSTLAVYPSEKSFSGGESDEDYDDDEYDEEDDDEDDEDEDEDEDDEDEDDEDDTEDDEGEAFSDDEIVINDYRDSIEMPFILTPEERVTPPQEAQSVFNKETLQVQVDLDATPTTSTTTTTTTATTPTPKPTTTTTTTEPNTTPIEGSSPTPSQRKWVQQRQNIQRYTPRYSPKASPTQADIPTPSSDNQPPFSLNNSSSLPPATSDNFPPFVQQLERAKQELHQEIARAKEASDTLTASSARLQESVSHLSDRIAISRQLLSALGCTLRYGGLLLVVRWGGVPLPMVATGKDWFTYYSAMVLLAAGSSHLLCSLSSFVYPLSSLSSCSSSSSSSPSSSSSSSSSPSPSSSSSQTTPETKRDPKRILALSVRDGLSIALASAAVPPLIEGMRMAFLNTGSKMVVKMVVRKTMKEMLQLFLGRGSCWSLAALSCIASMSLRLGLSCIISKT